MKKILILGCTGMLGHTLFAHLSKQAHLDVYGTSRTRDGLAPWFPERLAQRVRTKVTADHFDTVTRAVAAIQPDIVVNCIGLIKQVEAVKDPLTAISVNALLPHRISLICRTANARMIHISTDCVFSGKKGGYTEAHPSDAEDLYGRSKFLGEVDYPHCVTLRTSIIGHEFKGFHGLIEWFLSQKSSVNGFTQAIFSGLPTVELARVINEFVIPNQELKGVYHVSSEPISKHDLLKLVAESYGKQIKIKPDDDFVVDRSLNSAAFRIATGYAPPEWPDLIGRMQRDFINSAHYQKRNLSYPLMS